MSVTIFMACYLLNNYGFISLQQDYHVVNPVLQSDILFYPAKSLHMVIIFTSHLAPLLLKCEVSNIDDRPSVCVPGVYLRRRTLHPAGPGLGHVPVHCPSAGGHVSLHCAG